jgi:hypothetical protein
MTALVLIGLVVWFLKILILDRPAPEPSVHKEKTFTCAMKSGELEVVVHWTETENPILPSLEPSVRRWALMQDASTPDLYASLDAELARLGCSATTQNIILKPEEAREEPISRAERVKAALISDADTVQEIGDTINELREARSELWDNRKYPGTDEPIGKHLDRKGDDLIRTVLHGSRK